MLFLVQYEKITDTIGRVTRTIQNPIPAWVTDGSFYVDNLVIPNPQALPNMAAELKVDIPTKKLYYDYTLIKSTEERVASLEDRQASTEEQIVQLMMGGMLNG